MGACAWKSRTMERVSRRMLPLPAATGCEISPSERANWARAASSFPPRRRARASWSKFPQSSFMNQPESKAIRLLIVDDHKVVRLGLSTLLSRHAGIEVVGEVGTVAAAVEQTARLLPDVVLMDVRLPDGDGFEACRQIRKSQFETRVLFLTSFADEKIVLESIDAGGDGYLLKEIDEENLVRAIRNVAAGQSILDPAVTRRVLERVKNSDTHSETPSTNRLGSISPQERRVLALVAEGKTNKEIGVALGLSDKTVKNYLSNIMEKLQVTRRSQAAAYFVQHSIK